MGQLGGADIVREARTMLGTPFHHQGRLPGVGLDCVGLPVAIARRLGIPVEDDTTYPPETDGKLLTRCLEACCDRVKDGAQVGDLLEFLRGRGVHHLAIVVAKDPLRVIHARHGDAVREEPLTDQWARALVGVWRLKGAT